jgi:hypothetical protein
MYRQCFLSGSLKCGCFVTNGEKRGSEESDWTEKTELDFFGGGEKRFPKKHEKFHLSFRIKFNIFKKQLKPMQRKALNWLTTLIYSDSLTFSVHVIPKKLENFAFSMCLFRNGITLRQVVSLHHIIHSLIKHFRVKTPFLVWFLKFPRVWKATKTTYKKIRNF